MDVEQSLRNISLEINKCELCELCKNRKNPVPGQGNTKSKILFIGEAPGKNEDLSGNPFCGASGRLLDELLASINLSRSDVFITNIVKCRPKENRDPSTKEKQICSISYLEKQIEAIKPIIIITLGRHALNHFLPKHKISNCHGQAIRLKKTIILPLYHPAVALYNPTKKETLINDFIKIKETLNSIKNEYNY